MPQNHILETTDRIGHNSEEKSPVNDWDLLPMTSQNLPPTVVIRIVDYICVVVEEASPYADHRFCTRRGERQNQPKKNANHAAPVGVEMEGTQLLIEDPHE
jgi:hypothetical protein